MLRTFITGAVVAFVGSRIVKANNEGKLDGLKTRLQDGADRLRDRLANAQDALVTERRALPAPVRASRTARLSPSDEVSRPAPAHPWPVDPRAMPKGA